MKRNNNDETSDLTESLKKMLYMSVFLFSLSPTRHIPPLAQALMGSANTT